MPSAGAPRPMRPPSRVWRNCRKPLFTAPRTFSFGTIASCNTSSRVSDARQPSLSSFFAAITPRHLGSDASWPTPTRLASSRSVVSLVTTDLEEAKRVGVGHDASLPKCRGVMAAKKEDKLGWRASDTRELVLQDAIVPKENVLGAVNNGFRQFLHTLDGGRIGLGALALGLAEGALQECLRYTTTRRQFGKPIASFQGVHFALADMATEIEAAKHLVYHAAR